MRDDYQLLPVDTLKDEKASSPRLIKFVKYGFLPCWAVGAMYYIYHSFPNFGF